MTDTIVALALRARPVRWRKLPHDALRPLRLRVRYEVLLAREAIAAAYFRRLAIGAARAAEIHAQCLADLDALCDEACRQP